MSDHALCPRCRHENPLENRFCGSCGVPLEASSGLVPRRKNAPTVRGRALPARLGPAGKAVAVALAMLATEAGLSWLRHRTKTGDLPSPLTSREPDTAITGRLLGQSLEEVLIQEWDGGYRSRTFAWRAIRSMVITERMSSGRRSGDSSRAGPSIFDPGR